MSSNIYRSVRNSLAIIGLGFLIWQGHGYLSNSNNSIYSPLPIQRNREVRNVSNVSNVSNKFLGGDETPKSKITNPEFYKEGAFAVAIAERAKESITEEYAKHVIATEVNKGDETKRFKLDNIRDFYLKDGKVNLTSRGERRVAWIIVKNYMENIHGQKNPRIEYGRMARTTAKYHRQAIEVLKDLDVAGLCVPGKDELESGSE